MLIKNSISNTTKFFQKTLGNLKYFFSKSHYKKLPKSPPIYNTYMNNTTQQSYKDLDNLYVDFSTNQLNSISKMESKKKKKKIISSSLPNPDGQIGQQVIQKSRSLKKLAKSEENNCKVEKRGLVIEKLQELEMMDLSNLDHVLDVEQVVYYYSRLTCPVYLEIVDNFFMELYSEFFGSTTTYSTTVNV